MCGTVGATAIILGIVACRAHAWFSGWKARYASPRCRGHHSVLTGHREVQGVVRRLPRVEGDRLRHRSVRARWHSTAPGSRRAGTAVYFHVDDVDAAYKELSERGYTFNEEPYEVPVGRLVTRNDPDGNIVGLEDPSKGGLPVDG